MPTLSIAFAAFAGVAWGILGGALPGISPSITMALLLPFTYGMDPTNAIVLLAATYVGAEYGGSIPAILIRTPGTNAAAATVIDGYAMKEQGKSRRGSGHFAVLGVRRRDRSVSSCWCCWPSHCRLSRSPSRRRRTLRSGCSASASSARVSGDSLVKGLHRRSARADDFDHRHRPGDGREPVHLRTARSCSREFRRFW